MTTRRGIHTEKRGRREFSDGDKENPSWGTKMLGTEHIIKRQ